MLEFGVVPARGTLTRLDRAFAAFYRRCRRGEKPGFPRFKGKARSDSVEYGDKGCWAYKPEARRIHFMGVGQVKYKAHRRELKGAPKTCVLRREGRRWFACVVFGVDKPEPLAPTGATVGIDLGVEELVATSEGELIAHEDLAITNMTGRPAPRANDEGGFDPNGAAAKAGLNREILAAGWGQLLRMLSYKAEEAGRELVAVDPRHTSKTCHACGHVDGGNRSGAVFRCMSCGHEAHADVNAAKNILRAGLARRREREAGSEAA